MNFDALAYPHASQRNVVYATNGMVATSQPLAAQAGLDMLKRGGNAVDAAIATAASLTVLEPTSNGIGGDAFAIVWMKDKMYGLNASGQAPSGISAESVRSSGHQVMPKYGWIPVTVPGTPSAWVALSERFGNLPFEKLLEPAITYAQEGYPVSPIASLHWSLWHKELMRQAEGEEFRSWYETFTVDGQAPQAGTIWKSHDHAHTLRSIAQSKGSSFYQGELAKKMSQHSQKHGGYLKEKDLNNHQPIWVDPVCVNYRGYDVWELPPNGQGIIALLTLQLLKAYPFVEKENSETYHKQIEALKLSFMDGLSYITDSNKMNVTVDQLLSNEYAASRRSLMKDSASQPLSGQPSRGGTVYLATADNEGNMVSFIQSNYMGFGSGIVVPGTGISMQNRGHTFSLDPLHDNFLEANKRTYHTIIPGFLTRNNKAVGPFGVMGGFMQPQGHVQLVMNMVDFGLNPQAALDAPRWQWIRDKIIEVEPDFPENIARELEQRGHLIMRKLDKYSFGRGQMIYRNEGNGVLCGGTEHRTDGAIAAW